MSITPLLLLPDWLAITSGERNSHNSAGLFHLDPSEFASSQQPRFRAKRPRCDVFV
jgi:hypothetical protein